MLLIAFVITVVVWVWAMVGFYFLSRNPRIIESGFRTFLYGGPIATLAKILSGA